VDTFLLLDDDGLPAVPLVTWVQILGILSVFIVTAGAALAYASRFSPARRKLFESCGGILFVTGLVLLGFTFPLSY
jgi:hypothetical protein